MDVSIIIVLVSRLLMVPVIALGYFFAMRAGLRHIVSDNSK